MKKTLVTLFVALLASTVSFSQRVIDIQNTRDGEDVEYCKEHKLLGESMKNPEFKKQWDKDQAILEAEELFAKSKVSVPGKAIVYRIPVVFHVMHQGGSENISKAQIDDALAIVNRDYRRLNADANNVFAPFAGTPADVEIEFVYATKAPNGACFSGITRTISPMTNEGDNGNQQVDTIIARNDVFNGQWPGNRYLNVFVCRDIGGAAGYTYRPSTWLGSNMKNGIWILQNYLGSIGTGSENRSRTLTHEVGHWLNLPHVWGGTNNPGLASNCGTGANDDDGVDDTPECIGNTTCALTANTCNLDFAYWGFDQVDPVENYMNYSYCSKMFSPGQAVKMRTALTSSIGGRNNISSSQNLALTGADGNVFICKVDFTSTTPFICSGESISFQDQSYNNVKTWNWSFPGGTPATSNVQNPTVIYSTPGNYNVTLTATDSITSITTVKTNFVTVFPAGITLPYTESFENYTSTSSPSSFWLPSGSSPISFDVTNTAGSQGSKSIRLRNFAMPAGSTSELTSKPFDLSNIPSNGQITLSYKYAHSRRNTSDYEIFRVHASGNCGNSWSLRKTSLSNTLSTNAVNSEWTPSPSDWVQVHVVNLNNVFFVDNFQLKFSFQSDGGNNLFIDEINLYQGGPEQLNVNEIAEISGLQLYPNPVDEELNLEFSVAENADVLLMVQDITGKQIQTNLVKATTGKNVVMMNTSDLSSGMYFMNIVQGGAKKTIQFIVK